jgi:hypothetical protein
VIQPSLDAALENAHLAAGVLSAVGGYQLPDVTPAPAASLRMPVPPSRGATMRRRRDCYAPLPSREMPMLKSVSP